MAEELRNPFLENSRVFGISKGLNKSLIKVGLRRGEGKINGRVNKQ